VYFTELYYTVIVELAVSFRNAYAVVSDSWDGMAEPRRQLYTVI